MSQKILVIDDDPVLRKLLDQVLHEAGFEVLSAATGEGGLELYQLERPDLVLLDVAMPGMSGFDVAAAIRETEQQSEQHTLIVIMTAHARNFTVSVDFQTGIDSYLTKPLLPPDVVTHVQNLLAEATNR